jgi:RNase P/RNase MRP subunit POP5
MALTQSDKKEIETLVRKEIKDFLGATTTSKFESIIIDKIRNEIKKGNLRGDINDVIVKLFHEFYYMLWNGRGQWETRLKNLKN